MLVFGERYRDSGRGYWHEMGTESHDADESASSLAARAGLDYTITKRVLSTRTAKGHMVKVPDHYAVVSDHYGDEEVIAIVGREFEPIQNMHLAEMLDRAGLCGPNGLYSVDVAGKTQDGRTVFWALKAREAFKVAGDEYRDHWLIADGKDGNRALTMALTPVRHVCSNALAMAVAGASVKVNISHTKGADAELSWWLSIAPQLEAAAKASRDVLKRMGEVNVTAEEFDTILDGAYPKPKVRGKAQLFAGLEVLKLDGPAAMDVDRAMGRTTAEAMRTLAKREMVTTLFESYADTSDERNLAGTVLGAVNAVTDVENHRQATNVKENRALSNLYGPRYQAQAGAIKAALRLV